MAGEIHFDADGVTLLFQGRITAHEIIDANTAVVTHPDFKSFKYQLWILDPVDNFIINAEELLKVAEQDIMASIINPQMKVCVTSSSPLAYGIGRMWQAFYNKGPWESKVCHDLAEAKKWVKS